jgi:hypothetical protein
MDRLLAVVNRAEAHPHHFTLSRTVSLRGVHLMLGSSRFPAIPIVECIGERRPARRSQSWLGRKKESLAS